MISVEGEYYEEFRYQPDNLELSAAGATIELFNTTDSAHDMWIATELGGNPLAQSLIAGPGATIEFTIDGLAAGTYRFWCSIENHAELGMVGRLTVNP